MSESRAPESSAPVTSITVAAAPSPTRCGATVRVTVLDASSSSTIISAASSGTDTSSRDAVPDTRSVLSAVSTSLSTAVIVTPPVLAVAPDAKLSVAPDST